MTETKATKEPKNTPVAAAMNPPRQSFEERDDQVGLLHIPNSALDLKNRAYRWALQNDKFGRNDYGVCYNMGYRDTLQSTLNSRVSSDSEEKVIRQSNQGTYILMDAPIEYRQMTNDEIAQKYERELKQKMGGHGAYKQMGNELHIQN